LIPEAQDLISKLGYYFGVVRDVELNIQDIPFYDSFDLFGPISILEGVKGVFIGCKGRGDIGDHYCTTVAAERVLEEPGKLGVSIRDMHVLLCRPTLLC
jgi:hypothetical protein